MEQPGTSSRERSRMRRTRERLAADQWSETSSDEGEEPSGWSRVFHRRVKVRPKSDIDFRGEVWNTQDIMKRLKSRFEVVSKELVPLRPIMMKKFEKKDDEPQPTEFYEDVYNLFQDVDESIDRLEKEYRIIMKRYNELKTPDMNVKKETREMGTLVARLLKLQERAKQDEIALFNIQFDTPKLKVVGAEPGRKFEILEKHFFQPTQYHRHQWTDMTPVIERVKRLGKEKKASTKQFTKTLGREMSSPGSYEAFKKRLQKLAAKIARLEKGAEKFADGLKEIEEEASLNLQTRMDYFLRKIENRDKVLVGLLENCVDIESRLIDEMRTLGFLSQTTLQSLEEEMTKAEKLVKKLMSALELEADEAYAAFGEFTAGIDLYPPRSDPRGEQMLRSMQAQQQGGPGEEEYPRVFIPSKEMQEAAGLMVSASKSSQSSPSSRSSIPAALGRPPTSSESSPSIRRSPSLVGSRKSTPSIQDEAQTRSSSLRSLSPPRYTPPPPPLEDDD